MDDYKLARRLLKVASRIVNVRSRDVGESSLTAEQAETLRFFAERDGACATDLKEYLEISHQAARSLIERMRQKDFLILVTSPVDARAKSVYLSDKGKAAFAEIYSFGERAGQRLLRGFGEDEKRLLEELLDKINENVDNWQP